MFGMIGDGNDFFGELDIGLAELVDDEEPPSTQRMPGSADLVVEDKYEPLFTSATWTLVGSIRDKYGEIVLERSTPLQSSHTDPFIRRWSRQLIRQNKIRLRRMGVDVEKAYLSWGGIVEDLKDG